MRGAQRAVSYLRAAGRTEGGQILGVMFPTGELGAHKLQSYEFSALVSHDLIDSCKVFAAGPMGKADDGLVEVEGGGLGGWRRWWWREGVSGEKKQLYLLPVDVLTSCTFS